MPGNVSGGSAAARPLALEKGVGDGGEHDVMLPAGIRAAFEVVEAEFGFELLILLLDRPALMRESDQLLQRRRGRQMDEEVFGARRGAEILFAQQPDLGRQSSIAPVVGGRDADGREARRPRAIRAVAPGHPSPRARGQAPAPRRATAIGRVSCTSTSCDRGRPDARTRRDVRRPASRETP